ncbi:hypothetical protein BGW80DRAFT_300924 [Lactifluus volemus]|nr:hypothetical protein BGW80DRAFT_300924 [Lactifluus volemus]
MRRSRGRCRRVRVAVDRWGRWRGRNRDRDRRNRYYNMGRLGGASLPVVATTMPLISFCGYCTSVSAANYCSLSFWDSHLGVLPRSRSSSSQACHKSVYRDLRGSYNHTHNIGDPYWLLIISRSTSYCHHHLVPIGSVMPNRSKTTPRNTLTISFSLTHNLFSASSTPTPLNIVGTLKHPLSGACHAVRSREWLGSNKTGICSTQRNSDSQNQDEDNNNRVDDAIEAAGLPRLVCLTY